MSATTKIEWAHSTLGLWYGCTEISPACDLCYARRMAPRLGLGVVWNSPPVKAPKDRLAQLRAWHAGAARFQKAHGGKRRVFVNSMSDFFDKLAPQEWRDDAFAAFEECTGVNILLVTKRPQNILRMIPLHWRQGGWPAHVWLIITAENQEEARRRGKVATEISSRTGVRVVGASVEPMLEYIPPNLLMWANWLIVGGESGGPKARYLNPDWARKLMNSALLYGQRFFMKQMTNKAPIPADLMQREFPI